MASGSNDNVVSDLYGWEYFDLRPKSPCIFCGTETGSRLTRCGHGCHTWCLLRHMVFNDTLFCSTCGVNFHASDVLAVLVKYDTVFSGARYRHYSRIWEEMDRRDPEKVREEGKEYFCLD